MTLIKNCFSGSDQNADESRPSEVSNLLPVVSPLINTVDLVFVYMYTCAYRVRVGVCRHFRYCLFIQASLQVMWAHPADEFMWASELPSLSWLAIAVCLTVFIPWELYGVSVVPTNVQIFLMFFSLMPPFAHGIHFFVLFPWNGDIIQHWHREQFGIFG